MLLVRRIEEVARFSSRYLAYPLMALLLSVAVACEEPSQVDGEEMPGVGASPSDVALVHSFGGTPKSTEGERAQTGETGSQTIVEPRPARDLPATDDQSEPTTEHNGPSVVVNKDLGDCSVDSGTGPLCQPPDISPLDEASSTHSTSDGSAVSDYIPTVEDVLEQGASHTHIVISLMAVFPPTVMLRGASAQESGDPSPSGKLVVVPQSVELGQTTLAVGFQVAPEETEVYIEYSRDLTPAGESCGGGAGTCRVGAPDAPGVLPPCAEWREVMGSSVAPHSLKWTRVDPLSIENG